MNTRTITSMLLAWVLPGAGHFYLGRRGRAVAFFAIIVSLFVIGVSIDGGLYTLGTANGSVLKFMASIASMGSGVLYFVGAKIGAAGDVVSATFEYGTMFTLSAGLMNLLLVLDCYDFATGAKS